MRSDCYILLLSGIVWESVLMDAVRLQASPNANLEAKYETLE